MKWLIGDDWPRKLLVPKPFHLSREVFFRYDNLDQGWLFASFFQFVKYGFEFGNRLDAVAIGPK
jgi:hypothetical protein